MVKLFITHMSIVLDTAY